MEKYFDFLQCGNVDFKPFAVVDNERLYGTFQWLRDGEDGRFACVWEKEGVFRDEFFFSREKDGLVCKRKFRFLTGKNMKLNELGISFSNLTFGLKKEDDFFYHNENPRIYENMTFPIDYKRTAKDAKDSAFDIQAGNRWADPGVIHERIGYSPYQPFPAVLLGNYGSNHAICHGTLSQRVFFHNYLLSHDEKGKILLEVFSSFKATSFLVIPPERILEDEWYLGFTREGDKIDRIFANYTAILRKKLPPLAGSKDVNRTYMSWGSWNDGIFRNVNEELILNEAKYLKENFPTVRHIQLDDGYDAAFPKGPAHGLGVPYEGEEGVDQVKFPSTLRKLTENIRLLGLQPAIWIGGFCPVKSRIYQEHPEWFIDYTYRVAVSQPLDVSQEAVRNYMQKALDKLITDYGFDSVKMDFWSYAFEDSHDLYKEHFHSGYEWRSWYLKQLRKRLASDGYLQTGCDIVMGNPFLGEYFSNYRYGIDVGAGNWDWVRTNFAWGIACFSTHTGDLIVPNSDSIGLMPGLTETDAIFNINYCLVTHSMVEISGELSKKGTPEKIALLQKATCNPNNGQDVWTAKWDYRSHKEKAPSILYFATPHFSTLEGAEGLPQRTVGLFNLEDQDKNLSFTAEDIALNGEGDWILKDIWSGEEFPLPAKGAYSITLPPHGSRVFAVSRKEGIQLLDSNIRIVKAERKENLLTLAFDYGRKAEFSFNQPPRAVRMDGVETAFAGENKNVVLTVEKNSEITFLF